MSLWVFPASNTLKRYERSWLYAGSSFFAFIGGKRMTGEELKREFETACWCLFHIHWGTINHLNSVNRVYELKDALLECGVSRQEVETLYNKALEEE